MDGIPIPIPSRPWERIGKYSILALAFLLPIFFIPWNTNTFEIHKEVLAIFLLLIASAAYVVTSIEKRRLEYPSSWVTWAVLFVLLAALLSSVTSTIRNESFYNGFTHSDSFLVWFLFALSYFIGFSFIHKKDLKTLGLAIISGIGLTSLYGALQMFQVFALPTALTKSSGFNSLGSLTILGVLSAAGLSYLASLSWKQMRRGEKIFYGALVIIMFLVLLLLNDWILWLGLMLFLFFLAGIRFVRGESVEIILGLAGLALLLVLISGHLPALAQIPGEVRPSLSLSFNIVTSTLNSWRLALGTGLGSWGREFALHKPQSLNQGDLWSVRFNSGFNFLLTILVTEGILGLLAALALIYGFLRLAFKESSPETAPLFGFTLFLFISWFVFPMSFVSFTLLFLGLGALVSAREKRGELVLAGSRPKVFSVFSFAIILLAVVASLLFFSGEKYVAASYFENAATALNKGNANGALQNLSHALSLDGGRDAYWRLASQALLAQAQATLNSGGQSAITSVQGILSNAVQAAMRAVNLNPGDPVNWENLGTVYENMVGTVGGAEDAAKENFVKAAALDPQDPAIPLEIGRSYLVSPNFQKSQDWFQKSLVLKPDFTSAYFLLAQFYIKNGDLASAIQKIEQVKAQNPFDSNLAFQLGLLYYQAGQIDRAQAEFERAINLNSQFSNARYFLGIIYDNKGMKHEALDQFQKIAVLNPGNAEVKQIIANLQNGKPALSQILPAGQTPQNQPQLPIPESTTTPARR